ncbi:solute carrier family 23 member 3 isoform X2 [Sceloporus undulatus]|uniref:solute carrier family 23 member 3 isoform X2 n=1 Tax=Sceloporus undulatus TaxID=8520 RepID=UPI001C4B2643|nr:solute carrier family 23 member 3 isoform X2 [Sceloporus undulatus]
MSKASRSSQGILAGPPKAYADPKLLSWPLSCLLALQHLLVLVSFLCIFYFLFINTLPHEKMNGIPHWDELLARNLFACGIAIALQCGMGSRLPLIQAPSFEFLIPAMVLIQHVTPILQTKGNSTEAADICSGPHCENTKNWHWLFCEISGAVLISALVQVVLGLSGACGWIVHRCGPMVVAPSLSIIGLSAYRPAALLCSENWVIALLLVLLSVLLSQHLASFRLPLCRWTKVLLPFSGIWLVCGILRPVPTPWEMLHLSSHYLIFANSTSQSPWLKVPYPGEQGWPILSTRAVGIGVAMGIAASVNSLGCYLLCSKALRLPAPAQHACNRGLCAEGLASLLSAVLGSVSGTGSSMSNTCAARLTKTTSSRSVWLAALACVLLGLSPRLMGLLTTIPLGIHGGVLSVTYSVAVGTGVSYFQHTDIDSGRNIFIVGFTMFMGLLVPRWLFAAPGALVTGCIPVDLFFLSLLMHPAFITGFLSFFLENTVSGTLQERGMLNRLSSCKPEAGENFLPHSQRGSAQRYEPALVLRRHMSHSWYKAFPLCFLCPLEKDREEVVNSYPLEELHLSEGEATVLLLRQERVKPESELQLGSEQEHNMIQENLENHRCGIMRRPTSADLEECLCSDRNIM